MDTLILEIIKLWGPPGIVALIMFYFLKQSEKREAKKDERIQLLENIVIESYSERIEAASQMAEAMVSNGTALTSLVEKVDTLINRRTR